MEPHPYMKKDELKVIAVEPGQNPCLSSSKAETMCIIAPGVSLVVIACKRGLCSQETS